MEKKAVIIPENITLFRLKIVDSKIQSEETSKDKLDYKINVAHNVMHNLADERIKIGLIVDLIGEKSGEESGSNAHFNTEFYFKIKNLNDFYSLDENKNPIFHGMMIATLLAISFSTARGLIYERLSNTPLAGIILPVVSPQKMLAPNPSEPETRKK